MKTQVKAMGISLILLALPALAALASAAPTCTGTKCWTILQVLFH